MSAATTNNVITHDDDDGHVVTPYVMTLREYICKKTKKIGLFIPNKCAEACGWRKDKDGEYVGTTEYIASTKKGKMINGRAIDEARMIILATTGPLKIENDVNKGTPTGADYELHRKDKDAFVIMNRIRVLFVDENNLPLHTVALQYSMRGVAAMAFKNQLNIWTSLVNRAQRTVPTSETTSLFYKKYLWVFHPRYDVKIAGTGLNTSPVCCPVDVVFDQDNAVSKYYAGKIPETVELVFSLRNQCMKWVYNSKRGLSTKEDVYDEFAFSDEEMGGERDDAEPPACKKPRHDSGNVLF